LQHCQLDAPVFNRKYVSDEFQTALFFTGTSSINPMNLLQDENRKFLSRADKAASLNSLYQLETCTLKLHDSNTAA
jgi:hypothetical protein